METKACRSNYRIYIIKMVEPHMKNATKMNEETGYRCKIRGKKKIYERHEMIT